MAEPYKKAPIPWPVRREVALRYGCPPGGTCDAQCHYCGAVARIWWPTRADGKPGGWVHFGGHHLDHVIPEYLGGPTEADNLVVACQPCNCSKGANLHAVG